MPAVACRFLVAAAAAAVFTLTLPSLACANYAVYAAGYINPTDSGIFAERVVAWNGSSWSYVGRGMTGAVGALAVLNGELFAGGECMVVNGEAASNIVKWNGSAWSDLTANMDGPVYALAAFSGGILAGGAFTTAGSVAATMIAQWDGSNWLTVGSDVLSGELVAALTVTSDGSIAYIGGKFSSAGGISFTNVAGWTGSTWFSVGGGVAPGTSVLALTIWNGNLIAGCDIPTLYLWNGAEWSVIANSFGGQPNGVGIWALGVYNDTLVVGGGFTTGFGGINPNNVVQATAVGSSWSVLGSGVDSSVFAFANYDGALFVAGEFESAGGQYAWLIAQWNGLIWSTVNTPPLSITARALTASMCALGWTGPSCNQCASTSFGSTCNACSSCLHGVCVAGPAGNCTCEPGWHGTFCDQCTNCGPVYVGGIFTELYQYGLTVPASSIAKWDGTKWGALGSGTNGAVYTMAQFDGMLYVGGTFTTAGGVPASYVAVWNHSSWSAVGSGANGLVAAMTVCSRVLYVGGAFTVAGDAVSSYIASWDGAAWSALTAGGGLNGQVRALTVYNYWLCVGGDFTLAGGTTNANGVVIWNPLTSAWLSLGVGVNGGVYSVVAVAGGGLLYVGGLFSTAGGAPANNIAMWTDGMSSGWSALGTGTDGVVRTVKLLGGSVVAGGQFSTAGGVAVNNIAQWDGAAWSAIGTGINGNVDALAEFEDTLLVGGSFSRAGNVYAQDLAVWDGLVLTDFARTAFNGDSVAILPVCNTGWAGPACASCSDGYYGATCAPCGQCAHGVCDQGACTCIAGWAGAACHVCAPGYFGANCTLCATCTHGVCFEGVQGNCSCSTGWDGTTCDQCAVGYFGPNCTSCAACIHGTCAQTMQGNCSCLTGWTGTTCSACDTGYFGANCTSCAACIHGTCVQSLQGNCSCSTGWAGPTCNACATGYAGVNCTSCGNCQPEACNGTCLACIVGWMGTACDQCAPGFAGTTCSQCAAGYFGPACAPCSACLNGTCSSGLCTCLPGWDGANCSDCASEYFGAACQSCSLACHGACISGISGSCTPPCDAGWSGSTCEQCGDGYFASACTPCSACLHGTCEEGLNGTCSGCATGWSGPYCSVCASGYTSFGDMCISLALLIGGIVAAVVVLVLLCLLVFCCIPYCWTKWRQRRALKKNYVGDTTTSLSSRHAVKDAWKEADEAQGPERYPHAGSHKVVVDGWSATNVHPEWHLEANRQQAALDTWTTTHYAVLHPEEDPELVNVTDQLRQSSPGTRLWDLNSSLSKREESCLKRGNNLVLANCVAAAQLNEIHQQQNTDEDASVVAAETNHDSHQGARPLHVSPSSERLVSDAELSPVAPEEREQSNLRSQINDANQLVTIHLNIILEALEEYLKNKFKSFEENLNGRTAVNAVMQSQNFTGAQLDYYRHYQKVMNSTYHAAMTTSTAFVALQSQEKTSFAANALRVVGSVLGSVVPGGAALDWGASIVSFLLGRIGENQQRVKLSRLVDPFPNPSNWYTAVSEAAATICANKKAAIEASQAEQRSRHNVWMDFLKKVRGDWAQLTGAQKLASEDAMNALDDIMKGADLKASDANVLMRVLVKKLVSLACGSGVDGGDTGSVRGVNDSRVRIVSFESPASAKARNEQNEKIAKLEGENELYKVQNRLVGVGPPPASFS